MRSRRTLREDDRAIEGLPMRLIIALVVGVASLTLMMNMLGGFGGDLQQTEVDAELSEEVVDKSGSNTKTVITVVDEDGEVVEGATVIIKSGTATVPGGSKKKTPTNGKVTLDNGFFNSVDLNNQDQGNIIIQIVPPSEGGYTNNEDDGVIVVV